MRKECSQIWPRVVELALGATEPQAAEHLAKCESCRARLGQLEKVVGGLRLSSFEAPEEVVSAAKALMPSKVRKQVWARLLNTSRALGGVRGGDGDIQALFEAEGRRVRVQYRPLTRGWEVMGQTQSVESGIARGRPFAVDAHGRFAFEIDTLNNSAFLLRSEDAEIVVPSIRELLRDDT